METTRHEQDPASGEVWMRGLFMLLFMIAFGLGQFILNLLAVVQFLWLLFARGTQSRPASLWRLPVGLVCRRCAVSELCKRGETVSLA
jgi:hypothetical protein